MQITLAASLELQPQDQAETMNHTSTLIETPNQCPAPPTPPAIWVSNLYWLAVAFSLLYSAWSKKRKR